MRTVRVVRDLRALQPIPGFEGYYATREGHIFSLRCLTPREQPGSVGIAKVRVAVGGKERRLRVDHALALTFGKKGPKHGTHSRQCAGVRQSAAMAGGR